MNNPFQIVPSDQFLSALNENNHSLIDAEDEYKVEQSWMFENDCNFHDEIPQIPERSKALLGNELLQNVKKTREDDILKNHREVFQANQSKSIYLNKISQLIERPPTTLGKPKQTRQKVIVESDSSDQGQSRLAKNRESARNSRKRKKIYIELLESKVKELTEQIKQLEAALQQSRFRNTQLDLMMEDYQKAISQLDGLPSIQVLQEQFGGSSQRRWSVCTEIINLLIEATIPLEIKRLMESAKKGTDMFLQPLLQHNPCLPYKEYFKQGTMDLEIATKNFGVAYDKVREQVFCLERLKFDVIQMIGPNKYIDNAESGHDFFHIERVYKLATTIAQEESKTQTIDMNLVQLGALLHDIADQKFHGGDDTIGPKVARNFLKSIEVDEEMITKVEDIIKQISYKGAKVQDAMTTFEGLIVQDADRLDALGAIGIARCFNYGGYKNREIFNPEKKPIMHDDYTQYKQNDSPSINHFYEKLLLLKDRMNTETGKKMAEKRHQFMVEYLDNFFKEWNGVQ